jgi:hypothetical protein
VNESGIMIRFLVISVRLCVLRRLEDCGLMELGMEGRNQGRVEGRVKLGMAIGILFSKGFLG